MPCCGKRLCAQCAFESLRGCRCHPSPRFHMPCPFCRADSQMPRAVVVDLFDKFCPSHAKVLPNSCGGKSLVVAHRPCAAGCYGCFDSTFVCMGALEEPDEESAAVEAAEVQLGSVA